MEAGFLKTAGEIAGIGGLAIGTFLTLFRDVIRKNIFPTLSKQHAYSLLRLIVLLTWSIAVLGIGAWYVATKQGGTNLSDATPQSNSDETSRSGEHEISGQVRDEEVGVSDAKISDVNSSEQVTSDSVGRFRLKVRETRLGWARIQVTRQGYKPWEDYVETTSGIIVPLERNR